MDNQKLNSLKEQLRQKATTNPKAAMKALKLNLKDDSRYYNAVLQLQLQLNQNLETERHQLSSRSDTEMVYSQITKAFLDILREVDVDDIYEEEE